MVDLVIIGSGPAALSAAMYAAREKISTVVYERKVFGGLLPEIDRIENFPGFVGGSGEKLADIMRGQAEGFGAKFEYGEVTAVGKSGDVFELTIDEAVVEARAVLVATGSEPARLGVDGEKVRGVSYCATCDGAFYKDQEIAVIGGGNSAVQEALFLLQFVKKINLVSHSEIKASEMLKEKLAVAERAGQVEIFPNVSIKRFMNENERLTSVVIGDENGEREIKVAGAFVFVGTRPATSFLEVEKSEKGAVITDDNMMSSVAGIFAAGSVRDGAVNQAIVSAGEGATAAVRVREYLATTV